MTASTTTVTAANTTINWNEIVDIVSEELVSYEAQGFAPSLRAMFYRLVSKNILSNTKSTYKSMSRAMVKARIDGRLPIKCFSDSTRNIIRNFNQYYESLEDRIAEHVDRLGTLSEQWKEDFPRWYDQPEYVEVWVEKAALTGTFNSILSGKDVVIVPNKGYGSFDFIYDNLKRLSYWKHKEDKNLHVLYFGDHDPSGENMDKVLENYVNVLGDRPDIDMWFEDIDFQRIAVHREHIEEYNLPSNPDAKTIEKLKKDPRTKGFMKKYGYARVEDIKVVELDALPAIRPDVFRNMVIDSVDQYFDEDIYDSNVEDMESYSEDDIKKLIRKNLKRVFK